LLPRPITFPAAELGKQVAVFRELELSIVVRMRSSRRARCEVRVSGTAEIEKHLRLDWLLPHGPQWQLSEQQVGPDRWEHVAVGDLDDAKLSDWSLSTARCFDESTWLTKRVRLEQTMSLRALSPAEPSLSIQNPESGEDRWEAIVRGWQNFTKEWEDRTARQAIDSIAVPVRIEWEFLQPVEYASGPGYEVHDRVVTWNCSLAPGDRTTLTARAVGPNSGQWLVRVATGLGALGAMFWGLMRLLRRLSIPTEDAPVGTVDPEPSYADAVSDASIEF
jgi:hypothetical protein